MSHSAASRLRVDAAKVCAAYRAAVEIGDQEAWSRLWSENEPRLVVASLGEAAEIHVGEYNIRRLIFGATNILKNPKLSNDNVIFLTDDPTTFFWEVHIDFKSRDGSTFNNDLLIGITLENGKIKRFLEFGDPERRAALFRYISLHDGAE